MILAAILMAVAAPTSNCACYVPSSNVKWLSGTYEALPIADALQVEMIDRLKARGWMPISIVEAKTILGNDRLGPDNHYYLAKVGHVGAPFNLDLNPEGLSISVDVDSDGVAYVTTFMLTSESGYSDIAVVLISSTPLTNVISQCSAAE